MEFNYQKDYESLGEPCPPTEYKPRDIANAFRWVFETIDDDRNFMSQYHKNPKRFLKKTDSDKCSALALSMFDNLEGAINRFQELKDIIGETVYRTLGTNISEGRLSLADGVNGKVERHGHFNHHLSAAEDCKKVFKIINEKL